MMNIPDLEMMMIESLERINDRTIKLHLTNGQTYAIIVDEFSSKDGRPKLEIVKDK